MGLPRRAPQLRHHPLLDELRPAIGSKALQSLQRSLEQLGQLQDILVTSDHYILDGRARFALLSSMPNILPRYRTLPFHSGIGAMPPGMDRDEELERVREVIDATARGKWNNAYSGRRKTS